MGKQKSDQRMGREQSPALTPPEERDPMARPPAPVERNPGSPRERSDEDAIARPVQLDEDLEGELDEEGADNLDGAGSGAADERPGRR
jgi:hypothetical protein